ncbi:MAG: serine--tRNA ligase [Candidatus Cloacimonadota bacterium]|nr:MAG: serine--tRNA ligase [Candidatus Cloacimonadota bacterium]PIE77707.1 MAG: serine--tRNA ligase [Candidatus Delongbacteria bacterium]
MLDIRYIRENVEATKKGVKAKKVDIDIDKLLELDRKRRELLNEVEVMKAKRNKASKMIGQLKREGKDASLAIKETGEIGDNISELDKQVKAVDRDIKYIMMRIPNLPHETTPEGKDENDNVEVRVCGKKREFGFKPKDHLQLSESLKLMDFKRASKISGSGFPLYTGKGAILERALINFMLDFHNKNGFTEVIPPILALPSSMEGTSQLPKMEEDMYHMEKDDLYLIPTAEVTITNIYRDETLKGSELPICMAGYTPCFRREAGSYGKETRGLLRVHQFNKVEMVKIVNPDNSYDELEDLVKRVETILDMLKIPYRVLALCSGDLSFGAAKCYDIETWSPAEDKYLEASSCSNFEDFQARRMNLRFKREQKSKPEFVHTLNGSGIATSRLMVSILEHYQNEDGSITVPEVLKPYCGFDIID